MAADLLCCLLFQSQPVKVAGFEDHKVVAIATGDEFSLVVDDRGTPWTWGRTDQGQVSTMCFVQPNTQEMSVSSISLQAPSHPLLPKCSLVCRQKEGHVLVSLIPFSDPRQFPPSQQLLTRQTSPRTL